MARMPLCFTPGVSSETRTAVAAHLAAIPGLSADFRRAMLAVLDGPSTAPAAPADRVISRREAASRFNRTPRTLALWQKKNVLKGIVLPGHVRACGFRLSDIERLIGHASTESGKEGGQ